jgi:hypothetical protein
MNGSRSLVTGIPGIDRMTLLWCSSLLLINDVDIAGDIVAQML